MVRGKLGELKLITLTAAETEEHLLYAALIEKGWTPERAWRFIKHLRTVPDIRTAYAFEDEAAEVGRKVLQRTVLQAVTPEEEGLIKLITSKGGTEGRALDWISSFRLVPDGFDIRKRLPLPDLLPKP